MSANSIERVRPATVDDAGKISLILRELGWFDHINAEPQDDTKARIAQQLERRRHDDMHTILVAEDQNREVIGYIAVHWLPSMILAGHEGYISDLFVRESDRGKGIGRMLVEAVKEQATERGCTRLSVVNGRNRESYRRGFYQKLGWRERDEVINFILQLPGGASD